MILDSTLRSLEFKLGGAITTSQLPFIAGYADHDATNKTFTPGANTGQSNNTTAVTLVAAPGSGKQRQIKSIHIYVADTVSTTITVQYNDNGTLRVLFAITLASGESLQYSYEEGWSALTSSGKRKVEVSAGGGGSLSDGDYGDITVSGSGTVMNIDPNAVGTTEIANDAVTFSKLQNLNTDRLLGRDTAASGDAEEISVGGGLEFTGSTSIQRSALTGDVTAAAGSNATTIANDAVTTIKILNSNVTLAKIQNIGTDRLLGRDTAASGVVEELTVGGGLEFSGAGGIQRSAFAGGDVTAPAASAVLTIANDAVTFAKMQNITTLRLLGRTTAASGDVEEISVAAPLTFSALSLGFDQTATLNNNARVAVNKNSGATVGTRRRINFIEGTNITLTIADDAGNEEVDVTIAASGGGGGSPGGATGDVQYNNGAGGFGAEAAFNYDAANNQLTAPGVGITEDFALSGVISPTQITANQNDYAPTGNATASVWRISSDADFRAITGISGGTTGRILILLNVGSFAIILSPDSASSTAANRILTGLSNSTSTLIHANQAAILSYDNTSSRWRVVNQSSIRLFDRDIQLPQGVSPGALAASQNNYAPTGIATNAVLRLTASGAINITGLDASQASLGTSTLMAIHNIGSNAITLKDEDASSTAANRFALASDIVLNQDESCLLLYDATSQRWRALARPVPAGGGSGDSISVNGVAATDADFDDTTPAAPASAINVKFQKDSGTPNNISANVPYASPLAVNSGNLTLMLDTLRFRGANAFLSVTPASDQNDYNPTNFSSCTFLNVAPTASIKITGLVPGNTDRYLVITNTATDYLLILERESASSSAANRFTWSPVSAWLFLMPGDSFTFIYDSTLSRWVLIGGSAAFNNQFHNYSDCHGASVYGTSVTGTGASFQAGTYLVNSTEKPKGIIQVDTGTTATGRAYYGDNVANNTVPAQGSALYLVRLAVETLSDATNRYQVIAGFHDALGGTNVTDGVYWKYDDASAAVWRRCAAAASTRTETSATPTVDTNYIWLGIFVNAAWSRADYFYSTDSVVMNFDGSVSTNMPSSSQIVNVSAGINKTVGTTQRNLSIDLQADRYDFLRG